MKSPRCKTGAFTLARGNQQNCYAALFAGSNHGRTNLAGFLQLLRKMRVTVGGFFRFAVSSSKCNTQSLGIGVF